MLHAAMINDVLGTICISLGTTFYAWSPLILIRGVLEFTHLLIVYCLDSLALSGNLKPRLIGRIEALCPNAPSKNIDKALIHLHVMEVAAECFFGGVKNKGVYRRAKQLLFCVSRNGSS